MRVRKISFEDACWKYQSRFTAEHVPVTSTMRRPMGDFFAPQFMTDLEWYENTIFPGETWEDVRVEDDGHPMSVNQTYPFGYFLDKPFEK